MKGKCKYYGEVRPDAGQIIMGCGSNKWSTSTWDNKNSSQKVKAGWEPHPNHGRSKRKKAKQPKREITTAPRLLAALQRNIEGGARQVAGPYGSGARE